MINTDLAQIFNNPDLLAQLQAKLQPAQGGAPAMSPVPQPLQDPQMPQLGAVPKQDATKDMFSALGPNSADAFKNAIAQLAIRK
jgi:hypothetical protein